MKPILLIIMLSLFTSSVFARSFKCEYENEGVSENIKINIKGSEADVTINYQNKKHEYKKCRVDKDDFGKLIDCSALDLDFMVLINEDTGGVMSSSFDLFVDIDC